MAETKHLGRRQVFILSLMLRRGGYPGRKTLASPSSGWPYLSHVEMLLVLETLKRRGLVTGEGFDWQLTEAGTDLIWPPWLR